MKNKLVVFPLIFLIAGMAHAGKSDRVVIGDGYVYTQDLSTPCDKSTVSWKKKRKQKCKGYEISEAVVKTNIESLNSRPVLTNNLEQTEKYLLSFDPKGNPLDLSDSERYFVKAVNESQSSSKFYITVGTSLNSDDNESSLIRAGYIKDRLIANGAPRDSITINQLDFSMPVGRALIEIL